jgi:hypothetical protein
MIHEFEYTHSRNLLRINTDVRFVLFYTYQEVSLIPNSRHFTIHDKEVKKFEVTHNLGAITPSALVPIPQPDQRNDLSG